MALDLDAFGAMVRTARERRGLRAIDLAVAMRWAGTAPVYRYERGGPDAPRPDPDTINLLAQVLQLGYADRMTLLGLAGHLPETVPLTADEEARLLVALRPELERLPDPTQVFDFRGRILAVNSAMFRELGHPDDLGDRWREQGVTVFDVAWDPDLGLADRLVDPVAARRFQVLRFILYNQLRRHETWYRELPDRFAHYPGFVELWRAMSERVADEDGGVGLIPVVHAPLEIRLPGGGTARYDVAQRAVHGVAGLVALLVMSPDRSR
ncbi:MAG: hypothetical protein AVDCRST_MAG33-2534 [uncultured Thermomicrobiales bacterium]|uniref:HTH cro/C1-type domain-containing protein n=1 Tax=uncultured Thermomicrobiales bacterium TaxID=1645740 RepID=A0A6J4VDS4_9BACT|nr:MAG: hypothetical protein AVDCRST_MAG33-2534 [uncultured Thermomicrobiales bacterium]